MSQGRALVGGASVELLRAMVVVVIFPLLLLTVEFATCAASCPGSMDDKVPAARLLSDDGRHPCTSSYSHVPTIHCCMVARGA